MTNTKIQLRGHCQCCGGLQAVPDTFMSKHGYTVKHGFFNGVCNGHHYAPIEVSREKADSMIAFVRREVVKALALAADLEAGRKLPQFASGGRKVIDGKWVETEVPYAEAQSWCQADALRGAIYAARSRAKAGTQFADGHTLLCNLFHGEALTKVVKAAPAARIEAGERRLSSGGAVLVATYQDGARVNWKRTNTQGQTFSGWTGSKAWRTLVMAE